MMSPQPFEATTVSRLLDAGAIATASSGAPANAVARPGELEIAPDLANSLLIGRLVGAAASLPVAETQHGNVFADRNDPNLRWYLPAFVLAAPDSGFSFAANQTSVDAQGNPYNSATLLLDVASSDPPDVQQYRSQNPTARLQQIPFVSLGATLSLPYKDDSGNDQVHLVSGDIVPQSGTALQLAFRGLFGATVIQAYEALMGTVDATVQLQLTYRLWHHTSQSAAASRVLPMMVPMPIREPIETGGPVLARPVDPVLMPRPMPIVPRPPIHVPPPNPAPGPVSPPPPPPPPPPPQDIWTVGTAAFVPPPIQLGATYAVDPYRGSFTITADGTTRAIIDVNDLREFDVQRSEFIELTSLGDIQSQYPSFQRLYLGQVTGAVVAIPSAYGIRRGRLGCDAHLDALIDDSPTTLSGSWFQFRCSVAAVLDPVDLAQLAHDLLDIPEAAGRTLRVTLPNGLDSRWPATLDVPGATNSSVAAGVDGHSFLVSLDFRDSDTTPAITSVNMFLSQLSSPAATPLFGQLNVRLDDVYTPAVTSTVVLNLHSTSSSDDLSSSLSGAPPVVSVTNNAPVDLQLVRFATINGSTLTVAPFQQVLAAGQTVTLPVEDASASTSVVVDGELALPDPFPRSGLAHYVSVQTQTVQQTQHPLSINATALDFDANDIAELDIQFSLNDLPTLVVPSIVLTPQHRVDSVNVLIPVETVISGLNTTLTISILGTDASTRQAQVSNDFVSNPLFVLTPSALGL